MDDTTKVLLTTGAAAVVAFAGYWAKYLNDLTIARRKDRLERVSRQLSELYGPLYAHLCASDAAWKAFFDAYSPGPRSFWGDKVPTEEQAAAFRLWMTSVFMPMNTAMVDAFTQHADLIDEDEMPKCLLDLAAHVAAYRAVLKSWEAGDFSTHTSLLNFPAAALESYLAPAYRRLKRRQLELLGQTDRHQ